VNDPASYLPDIKQLAIDAGELIYAMYRQGTFEHYTKSDQSPVTSADLAAHALIEQRLKLLTPEIPLLSEEDAAIPLSSRRQWSRYWLVDPLDGTQEFVAESDDFATLIALVEEHQPVLGVVYAPVSKVSYFATRGGGAYKQSGEQVARIHCRRHPGLEKAPLNIAVSRRQDQADLRLRLNPKWRYHLQPLGSSSLKSCMVAEGEADCYIRLGVTGEWDTAATQCIVEEAGGVLRDFGFAPLSYNRRESLTNPNFIVVGDPRLNWDDILQPS